MGRHAKAHLPLTLARAVDAQEAAAGGALLERRARTLRCAPSGRFAAVSNCWPAWPARFAPARGEVELAEHPEFPPLLAKITAALTAFPEAAAAVALALALAFEDEAAA